MTSEGLTNGPNDNPLVTIGRRPLDSVASCWIEPRPDAISSMHWRGTRSAVDLICAGIPGSVDTTQFFRNDVIDAVEGTRMQVIWYGREGEVRLRRLHINWF